MGLFALTASNFYYFFVKSEESLKNLITITTPDLGLDLSLQAYKGPVHLMKPWNQCYETGTATFCRSWTGTVMHSGSGFGSGSNIKWNTKVKKSTKNPKWDWIRNRKRNRKRIWNFSIVGIGTAINRYPVSQHCMKQHLFALESSYFQAGRVGFLGPVPGAHLPVPVPGVHHLHQLSHHRAHPLQQPEGAVPARGGALLLIRHSPSALPCARPPATHLRGHGHPLTGTLR